VVPKAAVEVVLVVATGVSLIVVFGGSVTVVDRPNTGVPLGNVGFAFGNDDILVVTPNAGVVELLLDIGVSLTVTAAAATAVVVGVETIGAILNDGVTELAVVTVGVIGNENGAGSGFSFIIIGVVVTIDTGDANDITFSLVVVVVVTIELAIVFGRFDSFSIALGFL